MKIAGQPEPIRRSKGIVRADPNGNRAQRRKAKKLGVKQTGRRPVPTTKETP